MNLKKIIYPLIASTILSVSCNKDISYIAHENELGKDTIGSQTYELKYQPNTFGEKGKYRLIIEKNDSLHTREVYLSNEVSPKDSIILAASLIYSGDGKILYSHPSNEEFLNKHKDVFYDYFSMKK